MGVGHVPTRPFPRDSAGADVPRRQRRETGEDGAQALSRARSRLGESGERFARWWLADKGLVIQDVNVAVDSGEVDIVARDSGRRVVVEVRTITGPGDPIDAVPESKRHRVRLLAAKLGATRTDFVGLAFRDEGIHVHWVPG